MSAEERREGAPRRGRDRDRDPGRGRGHGRGRGEATERSGGRGNASAGASRPARVSGPRLVAYDVLRDVDEREAYANLALPARIREAGLDERDAALATELVAGSLRLRGRYDRIIELASGRPIDRVDGRTRNVLRLGLHQLLGMRTATHAAVNESVELQRRVANPNAAGFVNGVLRAVTRTAPDVWDERIEAEAKSPDDALAALTSHPAWVLRALRDALRSEGRAEELEELLDADNVPPRVSLAVLPGAGRSPGAIAEDSSALEAAGPSPLGLELAAGDPARAMRGSGAREGLIRVQDQGSQLAALALTRVREVRAGEKWLDLCAGPGGKTAVLGAEAIASGATVRANEVSEHRAELVRRSVAGVAEAVEVVSHDGRDDDAFGDGAFDRILVDAPCSGLGALRRRPEARWRKLPSDLPALTRLQAELLDSAAAHLAPGGILAYVTCSPHLAETRVVVDRFLSRSPEFEELDAKAVVEGIARGAIDLAGDHQSVQLWPHRHGTDAMFVSLMTRI